mmetsp:Transcript_93042/g.212884  ORF Transcript_93042/g.212884 Transcript_93042/m.212884 type:complete len:88 (+) Transcript_93042:1281-1544(+)
MESWSRSPQLTGGFLGSHGPTAQGDDACSWHRSLSDEVGQRHFGQKLAGDDCSGTLKCGTTPPLVVLLWTNPPGGGPSDPLDGQLWV